MGAVLKDVTPETVSGALLGAGVQPGERVTVIVQRHGDPDLQSAAALCGADAEAGGLAPEEIAEIAGIKDTEFERIFGYPRRRA